MTSRRKNDSKRIDPYLVLNSAFRITGSSAFGLGCYARVTDGRLASRVQTPEFQSNLLRFTLSLSVVCPTTTQQRCARKEQRSDGDGRGGAGGGGGRRGDLPVGVLRVHARRLHGRRHRVPQPARGDALRPPRHRLHPRPPPLRLQPPLRRPRRRLLQPHRRRRLLRRGPHQPLPLLHRAPPASTGRRRRGRSSGHLGAHAGAVQAHARDALAQGGSPHRRRRRRGAHLRHHIRRALGRRQGPPQPHRQDRDALRLQRLPYPHRCRVHRTLNEPCQRVWVGVC